ncbi:hypothetical protein Y032_0831g2580 [Ancylostoma ceylanicum]|uniref:Uncharacterized protein n=1 Tax=Ancylostoma ceylanicum TaxID=53326 RepID=A0A016WBV3_9BILA|nr:hypothetical protein Y032_0831g2580 [Ancylostoma ceylanicum]
MVSSGLPIDSPDAVNPSRWRGKNRLGSLMDAVREKLWANDEYRAQREEVESQMSLFPGYADLYFSSNITRNRHSISGYIEPKETVCDDNRRRSSGDALRAKRRAQAEEELIQAVCVEKRRRSGHESADTRKAEVSETPSTSRARTLSEQNGTSSSQYSKNVRSRTSTGENNNNSCKSPEQKASTPKALLDVVDHSIQEILLPGEGLCDSTPSTVAETGADVIDEVATSMKMEAAERLKATSLTEEPEKVIDPKDLEFKIRKNLSVRKRASEEEEGKDASKRKRRKRDDSDTISRSRSRRKSRSRSPRRTSDKDNGEQKHSKSKSRRSESTRDDKKKEEHRSHRKRRSNGERSRSRSRDRSKRESSKTKEKKRRRSPSTDRAKDEKKEKKRNKSPEDKKDTKLTKPGGTPAPTSVPAAVKPADEEMFGPPTVTTSKAEKVLPKLFRSRNVRLYKCLPPSDKTDVIRATYTGCVRLTRVRLYDEE